MGILPTDGTLNNLYVHLLECLTLRAEWFLIYVPIKMPSKNAIKFLHDPYKELQNFTDKVMPFFSCDDIDDGLQNQPQVAKYLDISVALCFKVKKNVDHHDTQ